MNVQVNNSVMRAEMARNRYTLDKLKAVAKVSRATLSAIRNGKTCAPQTAEKIAKAINITVEELLDESEVGR